MRLYKVVILVNLALAFGFLAGSFWREVEVGRLRQELAAARQAVKAQKATESTGTALGIVRGVFPEKNQLYLTHEDIHDIMKEGSPEAAGPIVRTRMAELHQAFGQIEIPNVWPVVCFHLVKALTLG